MLETNLKKCAKTYSCNNYTILKKLFVDRTMNYEL